MYETVEVECPCCHESFMLPAEDVEMHNCYCQICGMEMRPTGYEEYDFQYDGQMDDTVSDS